MSHATILFPLFGEGFSINPPESISVFGFPIYFYGMIIAFGFALAGFYAYRRREFFGLSADNVLDIFLSSVVFGIIGARLYYVIFNAQDFFAPGKWLDIIRTRDGGLAVYGGIIAGCTAAYVYAKRKKLNAIKLLDVGGLAIPIGQAIGRWGNFFNREAFGTETTLPWRMGLSYDDVPAVYVHPTFLYESLWNAVGFVLLHMFSKRFKKYDGQIFLLYLFWYGLGRFWIEGLRTDSLYIAQTGLRASQIFAAACAIGSAIVLISLHFKAKKLATQGDTQSPGKKIDNDNNNI